MEKYLKQHLKDCSFTLWHAIPSAAKTRELFFSWENPFSVPATQSGPSCGTI